MSTRSAPGYRPYALLAEVTYRCPLHCPYCSNPVRYPVAEELSGEEWGRVFREAAELGVLHVGLSGGEPLARPDLAELVEAAARAGLYINLITSAVGLTEKRASELALAGVQSVQISFQAHEAPLADAIAGSRAHEQKLMASRVIAQAGMALSLNVVLHRRNLEFLDQIIALAGTLGAKRLELANVQYYGWAFLNREQLLPSREQVETAARVVQAAKECFAGRMEIIYVLPDYFLDRPKPCMQGWGRRYLTVNPVGEVLPCPNAFSIPGLAFENVRTQSLREIWSGSASFNRFRGTEWMAAPCRDCPQREIDFGGCRCQAALVVGDANATDPVCSLSPHRSRIDASIRVATPASASTTWTPRTYPARAETTFPLKTPFTGEHSSFPPFGVQSGR